MRNAVLIAVWGVALSGCVEKEGDFTIEMPQRQPVVQSDVESNLVPLDICLEADNHGNLTGVSLGGQRLVVDADGPDVFDLLNRRILQLVAEQRANRETPQEFEAVIHADPDLPYAIVIDTIRAVSSSSHANGETGTAVQRIRFAPPSENATDCTGVSSSERE